MSEDTGARLAPLVLDASVLIAVARGDTGVMTLLQGYDADVAAVADASVCAILTLEASKWREHARDLDEPLYFIEIAEPGDGDG